MDANQLREVIEEVMAAERAEAERTGDEVSSKPADGADVAAIDAASEAIGKPFPESYRALLSACDGWSHFEWGMSLFGTEQLCGEDYEMALETLGYDEELTEELEASIIIGASEDNAGLLLLTPGGEVVEHMYEEEARHPDIASFLRERIKTIAEMRASALAAIAATEREWTAEFRDADDAALLDELRPLVAERQALDAPGDLERFVDPRAEAVAPVDLIERAAPDGGDDGGDDGGEVLTSLDLGLAFYLSAAPSPDEVVACFRAFRDHLKIEGPYEWKLADRWSFRMNQVDDPRDEPFADQLRVDDSGFFGVRVQHERDGRTYILNVRGIPPDTYSDEPGQRRASFVEVLAPPDEDPARIRDLCLDLADCLPVRSGHGGYMARAHDNDGWAAIFPWCRRFFAIEPVYVDGWLTGALRRHRGAGWLTVLGKPFVEALEPIDLSPAIERHDRAGGAVLVAGELGLGDVARGEFPEAIAEVARLLEPVALTGWSRYGMISMGGVYFQTSASQLPGGFVDHHATGPFMRRFVDPEAFLGPSAREIALELLERMRASMSDEQIEAWSEVSDLDDIDGFRDLVRALFNGAYFCAERPLQIEALAHAARFPDWSPPQTYNNLLLYYLQDGRLDDALALIPAALETAREGKNPHTYHNAACVLVAAGRLDEALACVRRARDESYPHMDKIAADDDLAPLRDNPEFQALVAGSADGSDEEE